MDDKAVRNEKLNLYGNTVEDIARQVLNTPPPPDKQAKKQHHRVARSPRSTKGTTP